MLFSCHTGFIQLFGPLKILQMKLLITHVHTKTITYSMYDKGSQVYCKWHHLKGNHCLLPSLQTYVMQTSIKTLITPY